MQLIVADQPIHPELFKHPGPGPLLKAAVRRGRRAEPRLPQRVPLTSRAQHKEDGVHRRPVRRPEPTRRRPQHLCLDKGFDYDEPRALAQEFGFTLHLRTRGEEVRAKRQARAKARRWVVERTHSWLNRFRAILIRWTKKPDNYLALLHLACGIITWRHALPG